MDEVISCFHQTMVFRRLLDRIAVNKMYFPERTTKGGQQQDGGIFFAAVVAMGVFAWQIHSHESPTQTTKTPWWKPVDEEVRRLRVCTTSLRARGRSCLY